MSVLAQCRKEELTTFFQERACMASTNFNDLMRHADHSVGMQTYADAETGEVVNVAVECFECSEVILDYDNDL